MSPVLHILLIALLLIAFIQDWKYRGIAWFIFPLIAIDTLLIFLLRDGSFSFPGLNLTFVCAVVLTLFIYVSLRERKWTNLFEHHLGLGDVLFFVSVTPLFAPLNFMLFFTSGMFVSIVVHGIVTLRKKSGTIPLAGYLALYLIALKSFSFAGNYDLFYKNLLL